MLMHNVISENIKTRENFCATRNLDRKLATINYKSIKKSATPLFYFFPLAYLLLSKPFLKPLYLFFLRSKLCCLSSDICNHGINVVG